MFRIALAAFLAISAGVAQALDGQALRHYAAGEEAAAHGAPRMASGHFGKALAILEAESRAESEDAAFLLDEMAAIARRLGDHARATAYLERALAITARVVGPDHPDHADRAARLAALRE
jgi:tetratricopeptide (TPR) repeat protein